MFNKNTFMSHLKGKRVAAIEMEANDPVKTIGPDVVANVDSIPAEKAGFVSDKKGADQNLEISKETAIGTEPDFDKQQEDYVQMGQEDGLALEHFREKRDSALRKKWALEDIAEIAQTTLDGEPPVENVEAATVAEPGISPEAALMVTRALDMDELGEEEQTSVALESFEFSRVAATESFVDRMMHKATKSGSAAGRYMNAIVSRLQNAGQRISVRMKEVVEALKGVAKDLSDVDSRRVTLDGKAAARVAKRVMGPSSTRDPYDALVQGDKEFKQALNLAKGGYSTHFDKLQTAVDSKDADKIYSATNAMLAFAGRFAEMSKSPYANATVGLSVSSVSAETNPKSIKYVEGDNTTSGYTATSLGGISDADINKAISIVDAADRAIHEKMKEMTGTEALAYNVLFGSHAQTAARAFHGTEKSQIEDQKKLQGASSYDAGIKNALRCAEAAAGASYDVIWGTVYNLGYGVIDNGAAVRQWGMETLSAGRRGRGTNNQD